MLRFNVEPRLFFCVYPKDHYFASLRFAYKQACMSGVIIRQKCVYSRAMRAVLRIRAQTFGGPMRFFEFLHALGGRAKTSQNDERAARRRPSRC